MTNTRSFAALGGALLMGLSLVVAAPAFAQSNGGVGGGATGDPLRNGDAVEIQRNNDRASASRQRESARDRAARIRAQGPTQTPAQAMASAQEAATAAGLSCQVTEATLLGQTPERHNLYEAACSTGPGYLITASTPPETIDCVIVAAAAARQLAVQAATPPVEGAEAPPAPTTCKLAANLDTNAVIAGYAREAGVTCQVDAGKPIGESGGQTVYEVGCAGVDGYRIQRTAAAGWDKTECLIIISANGRCEFTTPAEQHATLKAMVTNTDAAACVVDGGRYMGGNANGVFYEVKCSGAEGYIVRSKDGQTQQVYACAIAQPIGGGCTLTPIEVSNAAADAAAAAAAE